MNVIRRFFSFSGRNKVRWNVFIIIVLVALLSAYDVQEGYNHNRNAINDTIHRVGFLSFLTLPEAILPSWLQPAFRLGLDLQGGTHLVYDANITQIPDGQRDQALEGVRDVIERRINAFGVAEPLVQTVKSGDTYRVVVELAGIKDVSQAIKTIGDTPLLEFKEAADANQQAYTLTDDQKKELNTFNNSAKTRAQDILKKATQPGADFASLTKEQSEDAASKDKGGDIGFISKYSPQGFLESPASRMEAGKVLNEVYASPEGYEVLKLTEKRNTEKEVNARHILICYKGAQKCDKETSKEDAKKKIDELRGLVTKENFADIAKQNSTEPGADKSGGDLGWFAKGMMVKAFEDKAFALKAGEISDVIETEFGFHLMYKVDEKPLNEYHLQRILLKTKSEKDIAPPPDPWKSTGLTGKQLKRATVQFANTTQIPEVALEFNDEGKKLFAEITQRNIGKPVAIILDGQPISTPRVNQAITDGQAVISGDFTTKEAKLLVQRLNTGALPVPINLVSQQTVGASLGTSSLAKSLHAGLIAFLLVALFMILYYRLPGLLAVIALCMYTGISLAIFKVWPITLSLSGIAGFILSVGMAVDANILIFERTKEELRWGKTLDGAIQDGFKRAWTSIRDSNVSSLITCVILFTFSASLIKGFALTLAIGILVSMFSSVAITRLLLRFVSAWGICKNPWLFGAKKTSNVTSK